MTQHSDPHFEHLRLCLQLILQAHLHQFDDGMCEQKVRSLCAELGLSNIADTDKARRRALQVKAAQMLPKFA